MNVSGLYQSYVDKYIYDLDNILDTFAIRKHRRMEFKDILDDKEEKSGLNF